MTRSRPPSLVGGVQHGTNNDGTVVELLFHRRDGTVSSVHVPFSGLGELFVAIQEAAAMARDQQLAVSPGIDPRLMSGIAPMNVSAIGGALAQRQREQIPILSVEINGKLRLELALDQSKLRAVIETLEQLEKDASRTAPQPH